MTLVGVGGIGKTRLALQVAAEVIDAYRDGVWLVELGSISDPLLVPTSVAQVLGVQERTGTPLTDTLCAHLKARQLLLILDNCEHLLDACAALADAILRRRRGRDDHRHQSRTAAHRGRADLPAAYAIAARADRRMRRR